MNAITPVKMQQTTLINGIAGGSVLEIGISLRLPAADGIEARSVVDAVTAALRPHMGSEAFMSRRYDGLLEDWMLSTFAGNAAKGVEVWYNLAFDRIMSPSLAGSIAEDLRRHVSSQSDLVGRQPFDVKLVAYGLSLTQDLSEAALRDARLAVAEVIYQNHSLVGGGFAEPASAGWNNPGTASVIARPVQLPDGTAGTFLVAFRSGSTAIAEAQLSGPDSIVAIENAFLGGEFPHRPEGGQPLTVSWEDMLQRTYLLASRCEPRSEAQEAALAALFDLGSVLSTDLDKGFWGTPALNYQIDSASLPSYGALSPLGEQVRQVVAMAETQIAESGDLNRLAPTAIANLWVAHGVQVEAAYRAVLADEIRLMADPDLPAL